MDQEIIEKISEKTAEAVIRSLESTRTCCAAHCSAQCGFPPTEHAKKHQKADEFFEKVDQADKVIRSTAVKAVVSAVVICIGTGFLYSIYQWIEKVKH